MVALPNWNLSDFYNGITDPAIDKDKSTLSKYVENFSANYKGCVGSSVDKLYSSLKQYEDIQGLIAKLSAYSYLNYATQVDSPEASNFLQKNIEFLQSISKSLVFFEIEVNQISEELLQDWLKQNTDLAFYAPFLQQTRRFRPYQLSEEVEQTLIAKQMVARTLWVKMYDELLAKLDFTLPDTPNSKVPLSEVLNLLLDEEKHIRDQAANSLKQTLETQEDVISTIINSIVKDHEINSKLRGFKKPYSSMNLHNLIDDKTMETLVSTVSNSFPKISHRYYELKSKILKFNKLKYWDRNAPMFKANLTFSFEQSKTTILQAFNLFNPEMKDIAELFFDNNWIDAELKKGKMSGAFSHSTATKLHPYIMVNFYGKYIDISTLAHELGHGVHQYLARSQGELQSGTPLVLAETASIFGEELLFDYVMQNSHDENIKKYLLSLKIEGIINSVHRQIAFHLFEEKIHNERANGELSAARIKEIFIETQRQCLGPAVDLNLEDGIFWCYVSHFFHVPFYVYAYAFGDCLVRSLYATYKLGNTPNFTQNYMNLLKGGGTLPPKEAMQIFNFDISRSDFWQSGLDITAKLIDKLESLI